MDMTPEHIIQRIMLAFESRRDLPPGARLFQSYSPEMDHAVLEAHAQAETWMDLPHEVIRENAIALAFGTPEGFGWMLPAWLVASICLEDGAEDVVTGPVLTCLTRPSDEDARIHARLAAEVAAIDPTLAEDPAEGMDVTEEDLAHFASQVAGFSAAEIGAVRAYLEYLDAEEGDEYPVFGPRLALERYWASADTEGGGS